MVRVLGREGGEDPALGGGRILQLVDHQEPEAGSDRAARICTLRQQAVEGEEDVTAVEAARRGEDAVVGGVELGELALAAGRLALGLVAGSALMLTGLGLYRLGPGPLGLQLIDAGQQQGEQPSRVAANLVAAQRQLVEPIQQHRQSLRRPEHVEKGIEARGFGMIAQQPLADRVPGPDPQLLERPSIMPRRARAVSSPWPGSRRRPAPARERCPR